MWSYFIYLHGGISLQTKNSAGKGVAIGWGSATDGNLYWHGEQEYTNWQGRQFVLCNGSPTTTSNKLLLFGSFWRRSAFPELGIWLFPHNHRTQLLEGFKLGASQVLYMELPALITQGWTDSITLHKKLSKYSRITMNYLLQRVRSIKYYPNIFFIQRLRICLHTPLFYFV